jgi:hypothetical protein
MYLLNLKSIVSVITRVDTSGFSSNISCVNPQSIRTKSSIFFEIFPSMKKQSFRKAIFTGLATILLLGIYVAVHQWIFWLLQSFPNFSADALTIKPLNIVVLTQ